MLEYSDIFSRFLQEFRALDVSNPMMLLMFYRNTSRNFAESLPKDMNADRLVASLHEYYSMHATAGDLSKIETIIEWIYLPENEGHQDQECLYVFTTHQLAMTAALQYRPNESISAAPVNFAPSTLINKLKLIDDTINKLYAKFPDINGVDLLIRNCNFIFATKRNDLQDQMYDHMVALLDLYVELAEALEIELLQSFTQARREKLTFVLDQIILKIFQYQQFAPKEKRLEFNNLLENKGIHLDPISAFKDKAVQCYISTCCNTYRYENTIIQCEKEIQRKSEKLSENKSDKKQIANTAVVFCKDLMTASRSLRNEALYAKDENSTQGFLTAKKREFQDKIEALPVKESGIKERLSDGLKKLFESITGYRYKPVYSTNETIARTHRRLTVACAA